jgi:ankyrin repeat protein
LEILPDHVRRWLPLIVNGHEEVARILIEAGADVGICGTGAPGFYGKTAYDLALERGQTSLVELLRASQQT